ncbi:MAG: FtsX-like permease family protein [Thermoproteota archaeon]
MEPTTKELLFTIVILLISVGYFLSAILPPKILFPPQDLILKNIGDFLQPSYLYVKNINISGVWNFKIATMDKGLKEGYPSYSEFYDWNKTSVPLKDRSIVNKTGVWLAKSFTFSLTLSKSEEVHLFFEKVIANNYIWINGYFLAFHRASILPFSLDVTQFIRQGENNTLVLFLDTSISDEFGILSSYDETEPIVGNIEIFTTKGFLTRAVLITPIDEGQSAKLKVSLIMENFKKQSLKLLLTYEVYPEVNLSEKLYGTKEIEIPPGLSSQSFSINIQNPVFWQPLGFGSSTLYNLLLNFSLNNEFAGSSLVTFGIRTVSVNSTSLFINNKFIYLRGLTVTDVASFDTNSLNFSGSSSINFIHLVGFKGLERVINYCDKTGRLLVLSFPKFSELSTQIKYILMFYNHPSLIAWSEDDYRSLQLEKNQELLVYSLEPSKTSRVTLVDNPYSIDYRPIFLNKEIFSGSVLNFVEGFLLSNRGEGVAEIYLNSNNGERKIITYLPLLINSIRLLKTQFSSGISLLNINEFNSFSTFILPYLKPIVPILSLKGDYEIADHGILFNPETSIYLRVWLVNDLPLSQDLRTYSLNLTFYDITNKSLLRKYFISNISLPSYTEYPQSVVNLTQKIPELAQEHALSFCANVINSSKTVSEVNTTFYSLPMVTVNLILQKPINGFFILNTSNNLIVKSINGSYLSFKTAKANNLTILGPFSTNEILVPFSISFINLRNLNNGNVVVKVPVLYGSKIELALFPYIVSSSISITSKINYTPLPNFSLSLPSSDFSYFTTKVINSTDVSSLALFIPELNFMSNSFIVPANVNASINVSCVMANEVGSFSTTQGYQRNMFPRYGFQRNFVQSQNLMRFTFQKSFITFPNSTYEVSDLANFIKAENEKAINSLISDVNSYVNSLEAQGYYIEGTKEKVSNAIGLLGKQNSSNVLLVAVSEKLSYELLNEVLSNLRSFASPSSSLLVYMFIVTGILSLIVARIMFEKPEESYFASIVLFVVLLTIVIQTFPQTKIDFGRSLLVIFLLVIALASLSLILYAVLENIKTAGGVSLFAAISVMFSFVSGFLSKRKLRTFLVLFSIVTITWGLTCLSSVSVSFTTYSQTLGIKSSLGKTYLVLESTSNSISVTPNLLYFLSQISEIQSIAPKLTWANLISPLDTLAGVPISGVVSISTNSPLVYQLKSAVSPNEALYEVASSQGKIIISDLMAKSSGKQVGDLVFIKGRKYQIAGILNSKALSKISDVDGQDLLPKVIVNNSPASIPPEDVIILNDRDAMVLGSFVNKLYLELENSVSANNVANAISMFQNLFVYVVKPNSMLEVYYPGARLNVVGSELVLPIILGFLIIFLTFSSYTYERRREIFVLTTIGANPDHIFLTFLYESTIIGFIGGALGYILGVATFRFLNFMNVIIPVDVKVDISSSILLIFSAVLMSILGALLPSFRASVSAVPSLRRRWITEAKIVSREELDRTQQLSVSIPIVIPVNKAGEFASFLARKLRESAEVSASISNVLESEELTENGKVYKISFNYLQTGNRPFKSQNILAIRKVNEHYELELYSKITTIFTMFTDMCLRDVASFVRELSLKWSTEGGRIAVFVHSSKEIILDAIKDLKPRYVLVISRKDPESIIKGVRPSIQALGYNIAIEAQKVKSSSFQEITKELESYLSNVEKVYINSDDYFLSSAAVLALVHSEKKMVVKTPQGELVEVSYYS